MKVIWFFLLFGSANSIFPSAVIPTTENPTDIEIKKQMYKMHMLSYHKRFGTQPYMNNAHHRGPRFTQIPTLQYTVVQSQPPSSPPEVITKNMKVLAVPIQQIHVVPIKQLKEVSINQFKDDLIKQIKGVSMRQIKDVPIKQIHVVQKPPPVQQIQGTTYNFVQQQQPSLPPSIEYTAISPSNSPLYVAASDQHFQSVLPPDAQMNRQPQNNQQPEVQYLNEATGPQHYNPPGQHHSIPIEHNEVEQYNTNSPPMQPPSQQFSSQISNPLQQNTNPFSSAQQNPPTQIHKEYSPQQFSPQTPSQQFPSSQKLNKVPPKQNFQDGFQSNTKPAFAQPLQHQFPSQQFQSSQKLNEAPQKQNFQDGFQSNTAYGQPLQNFQPQPPQKYTPQAQALSVQQYEIQPQPNHPKNHHFVAQPSNQQPPNSPHNLNQYSEQSPSTPQPYNSQPQPNFSSNQQFITQASNQEPQYSPPHLNQYSRQAPNSSPPQQYETPPSNPQFLAQPSNQQLQYLSPPTQYTSQQTSTNLNQQFPPKQEQYSLSQEYDAASSQYSPSARVQQIPRSSQNYLPSSLEQSETDCPCRRYTPQTSEQFPQRSFTSTEQQTYKIDKIQGEYVREQFPQSKPFTVENLRKPKEQIKHPVEYETHLEYEQAGTNSVSSFTIPVSHNPGTIFHITIAAPQLTTTTLAPITASTTTEAPSTTSTTTSRTTTTTSTTLAPQTPAPNKAEPYIPSASNNKPIGYVQPQIIFTNDGIAYNQQQIPLYSPQASYVMNPDQTTSSYGQNQEALFNVNPEGAYSNYRPLIIAYKPSGNSNNNNPQIFYQDQQQYQPPLNNPHPLYVSKSYRKSKAKKSRSKSNSLQYAKPYREEDSEAPDCYTKK